MRTGTPLFILLATMLPAGIPAQSVRLDLIPSAGYHSPREKLGAVALIGPAWFVGIGTARKRKERRRASHENRRNAVQVRRRSRRLRFTTSSQFPRVAAGPDLGSHPLAPETRPGNSSEKRVRED
jgi:hypothetical protein